MRVRAAEVLAAVRADQDSISLLSQRFRGVGRRELLTRLHHLRISGQVVPVGNHRKHNTDRRWRIAESCDRQRGRTYRRQFERMVWEALHPTRQQNAVEIAAQVPACCSTVRRALMDLERQGAARRDGPARARRVWIRGSEQPACLVTRAALGTRATLLTYLAKHPGIRAATLYRRWSRGLINGAIRAGLVRGLRQGVQQSLWLAADAPAAPTEDDRIAAVLSAVGTNAISTRALVKTAEDSDRLLLLIRHGWLEGGVARVAGYGLADHHTGTVAAIVALRSFAAAHGPMSLDRLTQVRPSLFRRLQHQDALATAAAEGLITTD